MEIVFARIYAQRQSLLFAYLKVTRTTRRFHRLDRRALASYGMAERDNAEVHAARLGIIAETLNCYEAIVEGDGSLDGCRNRRTPPHRTEAWRV